MKRSPVLVLLLSLLACALPGAMSSDRAAAQEATGITLRVATFAPRGSTWFRVFSAWGNSLRSQTGGRLTLQVVAGATQGDERATLARIRANELEGATFTALGLGLIARPVLVMQAPGVIEGYPQLDRVRTAMDGEWRSTFEAQGFTLAGWTDVGQARVFSTRPIAQPSDLRDAHPWVMEGDTLFPEFLRTVECRGGVTAPIAQVLPGLTAGRIDTVVASPTAVSALQWHTRLTHVMQQSNAVLVGATLFSREDIQALPADLQEVLRTTGAQAHQRLSETVRREDDRYFQTLTGSGAMTTVDAAPHEAAWRAAAQQTRERMVGPVFSRELLDRVLAARGS